MVVFGCKILSMAGTVQIPAQHNEQGLEEVKAGMKMKEKVQITVKRKKSNE